MSIAQHVVAGEIEDETVVLTPEDWGDEAPFFLSKESKEEDTDPSGHMFPELPGALPQTENDAAVTGRVPISDLICPSCARPPGAVVQRGVRSEFQMGVRWTVNQLKKFLELHMPGVQAEAVALKFSEIVVED